MGLSTIFVTKNQNIERCCRFNDKSSIFLSVKRHLTLKIIWYKTQTRKNPELEWSNVSTNKWRYYYTTNNNIFMLIIPCLVGEWISSQHVDTITINQRLHSTNSTHWFWFPRLVGEENKEEGHCSSPEMYLLSSSLPFPSLSLSSNDLFKETDIKQIKTLDSFLQIFVKKSGNKVPGLLHDLH